MKHKKTEEEFKEFLKTKLNDMTGKKKKWGKELPSYSEKKKLLEDILRAESPFKYLQEITKERIREYFPQPISTIIPEKFNLEKMTQYSDFFNTVSWLYGKLEGTLRRPNKLEMARIDAINRRLRISRQMSKEAREVGELTAIMEKLEIPGEAIRYYPKHHRFTILWNDSETWVLGDTFKEAKAELKNIAKTYGFCRECHKVFLKSFAELAENNTSGICPGCNNIIN